MYGMRCLSLSSAIAGAAFLVCLAAFSYSDQPARASKAQSANPQQAVVKSGQQAELVHQGRLIFDETPKYASSYVGNKLACNDCHIQSGTAAYAAPMINLSGLFPMFQKRAGHVISIQNRIQECFARSEAGRPLPEDSEEMQALVAYINWLSRDGVKGKAYKGRGLVKLPALTGDPVRGKSIYASQCAGCHGKQWSRSSACAARSLGS
jgi:thiosulfate dehydrogenase